MIHVATDVSIALAVLGAATFLLSLVLVLRLSIKQRPVPAALDVSARLGLVLNVLGMGGFLAFSAIPGLGPVAIVGFVPFLIFATALTVGAIRRR